MKQTNDAEAEFWARAAREGLPRFRLLRRPLSAAQIDRALAGTPEWERLKTEIKPGDQLWPFDFNVRRYLGLRRGYLLLRRGKPVGGVVTVVS